MAESARDTGNLRQVTIVIAAYNAAPFIARAIVSALAEPETAEVVVVDDASTDDTVTAAKAADDGSGRLIVLTQPRNAGPAAARNRAIAASTAPWIGVLDADDFFLPGRLCGLLAAAKDVDFIADDMWKVDAANIDGARSRLIGDQLALPCTVDFTSFVESNIPRRDRPRGELGFLKPLMRRAFLDRHGLKYREELRLGEDYEFYTRALAHGARLILLPVQGYVSATRADSLSGQHTEEDLRQLRDGDEALMRLPGLSADRRTVLRGHYQSTDCRLQWRLLINAVKAHDWAAAMRCFLRSPSVSLYLLRQLAEQAVLRGKARLAA